MGHRRRNLIFPFCCCLLFVSPCTFFSSFDLFSSGLSSDRCYLSFPASLPASFFSTTLLTVPCRAATGSNLFSGGSRRSTTPELLKSGQSSEACSSDLALSRRDHRLYTQWLTWRTLPSPYITPPLSVVGEDRLPCPRGGFLTGEVDPLHGDYYYLLLVFSELREEKIKGNHRSFTNQAPGELQSSFPYSRTPSLSGALFPVKTWVADGQTLIEGKDPRFELQRQGPGPSRLVLFSNSISYGPILALSWPRSVFLTYLRNPLTLRKRYFEWRDRGHLSKLSSIPWFWFYGYSLRNLAQLSSIMERPVSDNYGSVITSARSIMFSFKEKKLLPISSQWERSFPFFSLLGERTFPPIILLIRGQVTSVFLAFKPKNRIFHLTVLSSRVAVYSGPGDATILIAMRFGGRGIFSTSQFMVTIWIAFDHSVNAMLLSVDELGLKTAESTDVLVFADCHISPDELSSLLKLESLSLLLACSFSTVYVCYRVCPISLMYSFSME